MCELPPDGSFPSGQRNNNGHRKPQILLANQLQDDDKATKAIKKSGCHEFNEMLLECHFETKDWRKCKYEMDLFKKCMEKNSRR